MHFWIFESLRRRALTQLVRKWTKVLHEVGPESWQFRGPLVTESFVAMHALNRVPRSVLIEPEPGSPPMYASYAVIARRSR
jgi:hypothetical protein